MHNLNHTITEWMTNITRNHMKIVMTLTMKKIAMTKDNMEIAMNQIILMLINTHQIIMIIINRWNNNNQVMITTMMVMIIIKKYLTKIIMMIRINIVNILQKTRNMSVKQDNLKASLLHH